MSSIRIWFGLSFLIPFCAMGFNHGHFYHQRSILMQSGTLEGQYLKLRSDGSLRDAEVSFYNQTLDHSDKNSPTFKQRYFIDSRYAGSPQSPVFYIICGEWNCAGTGSYSFVENLAKKKKAHLIALEHRFYGESLPTKKLTSTALKHLHLQAAIDDLASFQSYITNERGFKGKWVAFGGSYAGTLAAFYREKHPELVVGALASSAPVFMKNEFSEYDAHVAKVINKTNCGVKVRNAIQLIEEKISTPEGAIEVKKIFKSSALTNNVDFLYVVADMLAAAVQYGHDQSFCETLNKGRNPIEDYARAGLSVLSAMGTTPFDISLAVAVKEDVTAEDNMRQWMWQSCSEFGWFQVANGQGANSSRSSQIDLPYHDGVCKRLFTKQMGKDGALNNEWFYPLFQPVTSDILFTNGSNDPWLNLSVVTGQANGQHGLDLLMMEGAAHCNDLRLATNFPSVLVAHAKIELIIGDWIK